METQMWQMLSLVVMVLALGTTEGASPQSSDRSAPHGAAEECRALVRKWEEAVRAYPKAFQEAKTPEEKKAVRATYPKPAFQDRFMELARKYPMDPGILDALVWVLNNPWYGPQAEKNVAEVLETLGRDFILSDRLGEACLALAAPFNATKSAGGLDDRAEHLLRLALQKSPHRKVRGQACFSLASYLRVHSSNRSAHMEQDRADKMGKEAEHLFEEVIARYADVEAPYRGTIGTLAHERLFKIRNLSDRRIAPEIEGRDVEGRPMKLSDYRGKVILLVFWGSWCGPCMGMVKQERTLVDRMRGKAFVLLGVNSDSTRERAKKVMETEGITWRSWWDGGSADGPIAMQWSVMGWPTLYLIDARGVIRQSGFLRDQVLVDGVAKVMQEMEQGSARK